MKTIAFVIIALIGFTTALTLPEEEWEALTADEQLEIIRSLVIPYSREHGTRDIKVLIERKGGKVIIKIRSRTEEV